jgi:hypothetical protein
MATDGKEHLSLVICGHVDSGKSTTTGRLLFELGGIPERELEKLKEEAAALGKQSFAFAFYMDRQKEERERGVTISCTTKEFFTDKWHYTIIDAPGESKARLLARPLFFPFFPALAGRQRKKDARADAKAKATNSLSSLPLPPSPKQATATSSRT